MTRRDVVQPKVIGSVVVLVLALLSLTLPVGAQSPVATGNASPVATPVRPTIDPRSATGRLLALRDSLEADRLLLAELRKDVPTTREEGEAFVSQVLDLALRSDPVGVGVIASRVREAAPAWFEWRATEYPTAQEAADAYARSGAAAFDTAWANLHDAALLTVVNRLDTIIDLADRIEDGQ